MSKPAAPRRILVIDGHPDSDPSHFVHALADAYCTGAAKHEVELLRIADLDFPILRNPAQWLDEPPHPAIAAAQEQLLRAEHVVLFYPLWLGDAPALVKAFLEQVLRPGFAFEYAERGLPKKLLKGRSARVVVTMGMPALFYRLFFGAHSVKILERNMLRFVGFRPVEHSIIGNVEDAENRKKWLGRMTQLGSEGQ